MTLYALGNLELLDRRMTAFFCSSRCPGDVILSTYEIGKTWRDEGRCVISGFHSPMEKECLRILLRGEQPIVICPARGLQGMRIPMPLRKPLSLGRLLILSGFSGSQCRPDVRVAETRNSMVAALADEVFTAHAALGGKIERRVNAFALCVCGEER